MRADTTLKILQLAETYAQDANTPRRASSFAALEFAAGELSRRMDAAQKAFEFEVDANRRLQEENAKLRKLLAEAGLSKL